jgi:putative (di)nucleoside polyphosphate hydrolase
MTFEDLPYRPSVGVALFNQEGKVFLGRRKRRRSLSP